MPTHTTHTTDITDAASSASTLAAAEQRVAMHRDYATDLADLLRCLRGWIDAEHDQLDPLLAKHDYDIVGLRTALDLYTALLTSSDDQTPL